VSATRSMTENVEKLLRRWSKEFAGQSALW
jgi:hypothetical protein